MAATASGTDRPRSVLESEDEFYVLVDLGSDAITAQELLDAGTCQLVVRRRRGARSAMPGRPDLTLCTGTVAWRCWPQGLDAPTPFLSVAGHVFRGQHQEVVGSQLLFRKDAQRTPARRHFHQAKPSS